MTRDRRTYLGGTAAATIMLGERYGTTAENLCLWYQGQYELPKIIDAPDVRRGQRQEPVAIAYLQELGWQVADEQRHCYGHSVGLGDHLGGTLDGICKPPGLPTGILEVKVPRSSVYHSWLDHGVPQGHVWQVRLYMALTGYDRAYVVAYNPDGDEHTVFTVLRDEHLETAMLSAMQQFWDCAQSGTVWDLRPSVDAPVIGSQATEASADLAALIAEHDRAKHDLDFYKKRLGELKKRIEDAWPEDAWRVVAPAGTASYVQPKPQSKINIAKLRAEYPEVYEQVMVVQRRSPYLAIRTVDCNQDVAEIRGERIRRAKQEAKG